MMARAEKEENVTRMILEVDLKCQCCYKKVKKLLCKFPQIRDQVFDEDKNKVMITVVCCSPEKIRDQLCCKGGKFIHTIEILEPPSPPSSPPPPPSHSPRPSLPPPPPSHSPRPSSPPPPPPRDQPCEKPEKKPRGKTKCPPVSVCCQECNEGRGGGPCHCGYGRRVPPRVPVCCQECQEGRGGGPCHYGYGRRVPPRVPVCCQECQEGRGGGPCHHGYGRRVPTSRSECCQECREGRGGGPCHHGYGRPIPPPPGPFYEISCTGNMPYCVTRCGDYLSEENPQGCSIV